MRANIVKNLANSPLLPLIFALLARILILNLYRLALIEVPLIGESYRAFSIRFKWFTHISFPRRRTTA
jgi:hypothetical protein